MPDTSDDMFDIDYMSDTSDHMSDTSDYTLGDLSPEEEDAKSTSGSRGSPTVMDQAADEVEDVLQAIRDGLKTTYEITKAQVLRLEADELYAKRWGFDSANNLLSVLRYFGYAVAALPEPNHAELGGLLVEIVAEASSPLAAIREKDKIDDECTAETGAATKALVHKCQMEAVQRARRSLSCPEQATAILREHAVKNAFSSALTYYIGYEHPDVVWQSVNILQKLLSKYEHSLTAVYGTASGLSDVYVEYAKSIVSEMDSEKETTDQRILTRWLSYLRQVAGGSKSE